MGLLDSVLSAVTGNANQGGLAAAAPQMIAALLQQFGGQGGAAGGLAGLVQQLSQSGLADQVQSWVGTGANMPVSAQQLESALGGGQLAQLAQQFGLNPGDLAAQLSSSLPDMINQLTPNGQLPQGDISSMLGSLGSLLKG